MRPGLLSFPTERIRRYESDLTTITATGDTFFHYFGRAPAEVVVRLECVTANNGYVPGDQIPIESVWANDGNNDDGAAYRVVRVTAQSVFVRFSTGTLSFFAPNAVVNTGNVVNLTLAQWKLKVYCTDSYPIA